MKPYTLDFYRELDSTAAPSAAVVLPLIFEVMNVKSVIDIGCGDGGWLAAFKAAGINDIHGIDGDWVDESFLKISREKFSHANLSQPLTIGRSFDLSMSLEVAEHLPRGRASGFVDDLTRLAPVVLFSAAIPGQGGLNHINEQWPAYWAELFTAQGYQPVDFLRWSVWNNPDVTWWYKQNLLLFASEGALRASPKLAQKAQSTPAVPYAVVHPERFAMAAHAANPGFGRWLKMGKNLLSRTFPKQKA